LAGDLAVHFCGTKILPSKNLNPEWTLRSNSIKRVRANASNHAVKTLHNYLTRQVLASLFLTVAVFTFVLLIGNVLKEILPMLVSGHARIDSVLEAIGLLIPFVWVFALPMGLLTAMLLVFGRFSADQELIAARASGISLLALITPVLLLSLLCCGVSAWINMELGPQCRVAYVNLFFKLRADLLNVQIPEGQFVRDFPGFIFYTEKNHEGNLQDVIVLKLENETNVSVTVRAPRGRIEVDAPNKQLILHLFDARSVTTGAQVSIGATPELIYPLSMNAGTNKVFKPSISDMTFWQLRDELAELDKKLGLPPDAATNSVQLRAQLADARKQRKDLTEPIRVEMNRQIAFSFACFGFTLVGIPLGIRVHRRETNIGVAIALGLVLIYYCFILTGKALSARPEFAPHLIVWLPNFIFQAVGVVLLWRANRGI
jgi:lipopolysaccharide export system permease protein